MDGKTFANTKEHVADKQDDDGETERFANTKQNIALINDPKNGPRFTMTKREAGVVEDTSGKDTSSIPSKTSPPHAHADGPPDKLGPSPRQEHVEASAAPAISEPAEHKDDGPGTSMADEAPAQHLSRAETRPLGVPPAIEPPSKMPIDSSKTFVGVNGTYYDESWRWMDWRGTRRSWNWPAALSFGHWFAYRRLHRYASLHVLWLAGLAAAMVNNVPILGLIAAVLLITGLTGAYGNRLYFLAYRRAVSRVTRTGEGSYQALQDQLAAAGGTSTAALSVMGALSLASIISALGATFYLRGTLLFNLWPLF